MPAVQEGSTMGGDERLERLLQAIEDAPTQSALALAEAKLAAYKQSQS